MAAPKQFHVGNLGYGLPAQVFHIPFIDIPPNLKLHSVVQRKPARGSSAPSDHPTAKHYSTADDLLADADVDAVIVGTPPNTQFALASAGLGAGKHVLVEPETYRPFYEPFARALKTGKQEDIPVSASGLVLRWVQFVRLS